MAYSALASYGMELWQSSWSVSVFVCKYLLLSFLAIAVCRRWSDGSLKRFNSRKQMLSTIGEDFKQLLMFYSFEAVISIFAAGLTLLVSDTNPYFASLPFLAIMISSLVLKGLPEASERIYSFSPVLLLLFVLTAVLCSLATSWLLPSLAALTFYGIIFWEL